MGQSNIFQVLQLNKRNLNTEFYKQILLKIQSNFKITQNKRTNTTCTLNNITNDKPFDPTTYKSIIGSLIYLAKCTRPDISFAIHHAARQCENPSFTDWHKIINILKYLNNTKYNKILYNGLGPFHGYTDVESSNRNRLQITKYYT